MLAVRLSSLEAHISPLDQGHSLPDVRQATVDRQLQGGCGSAVLGRAWDQCPALSFVECVASCNTCGPTCPGTCIMMHACSRREEWGPQRGTTWSSSMQLLFASLVQSSCVSGLQLVGCPSALLPPEAEAPAGWDACGGTTETCWRQRAHAKVSTHHVGLPFAVHPLPWLLHAACSCASNCLQASGHNTCQDADTHTT